MKKCQLCFVRRSGSAPGKQFAPFAVGKANLLVASVCFRERESTVVKDVERVGAVKEVEREGKVREKWDSVPEPEER